jgi:hypothetical protein
MTKRKTPEPKESLIPIERIEKRIFLRGDKVMLSTDLAELYEVEPRVLVQAVNAIVIGFLKTLCSS